MNSIQKRARNELSGKTNPLAHAQSILADGSVTDTDFKDALNKQALKMWRGINRSRPIYTKSLK